MFDIHPPPVRLVVLISGGGTTLVNLQQEIVAGKVPAKIVHVVASRACQGIRRANELGFPVTLLKPKDFATVSVYSEKVFSLCRDVNADLVVLAGFLSRIEIPVDFRQKVMNIHPALIPAFCGEGMYGHYVHVAVIERGCKVSGCTVHFCDNEYDHGPIILQKTVPVEPDDTPDTLAARVFEQECVVYPEAIRLFAEGRLQVNERRVRILSSGS